MTARLTRGNRELVPLGGRAVVSPRQRVHLIGEVVQVAARSPDHGVHQDRGVDTDHVRSALHEIPPPDPLDVVLELDPQRTVVPARADTAVDLARLEDEPAALAERDESVHRDHGGQDSTAAGGSRLTMPRPKERCATEATLLRVGDEERPELDWLEAVGQLAVVPGPGDLLEPEVLLVSEALIELALAEDAAVVRVSMHGGVVWDRAESAELVH